LAGAATVAPFVATAAAVADAAPEIVVVGAEIDDEGEGSGGGGDGNGGGGGECRAGFAALSAISGFYPRTMMWGMEGRWVVCCSRYSYHTI
jgi:hypothetical protein